MASDSISSAQSTPITGTFVRMFVPFLVIVLGMVAGVMVTEVQQFKSGADTSYQYNDAVLYLIRDLLPNGLLGLAITGLLASFMAGMAANISTFNTAWGVDIYQHYIKKNADDAHYLMVGKLSTLTASVVAILTATIASNYSNLMDYLQTLFSMFNAPLFATFIIGVFWKRATPHAGWIGLISGTLGALVVNILIWTERLVIPGQDGTFLAAGVAFTVDVVATVLVFMVTKLKPDSELKGFVYALTPKSERTDPHLHELLQFRRPIPLGIITGVLIIALNSISHQFRPETRRRTLMNNRSLTDIRVVITGALGLIGLYLAVYSVLFSSAEEMNKTGDINANLWSGLGLLAIAVGMGLWWWIKPSPSGGEQGGD